MTLKYRPEIDGLRAIAVMVVIFFHAGISIFSGGFVGVDVFFVLSGYLISSIILKEKADGNFSLINFYERRARRILPALFLIMFLCLPLAWFFLLPQALESFSKSLIAVTTFVSNILFWRESGYFSAQADLKPLLHTWTLSVEEQFYIFLPLFIILTWKLKSSLKCLTLIVITIGSLTLSQIGLSISPTATFYLLPTRAWELFIGVSIGYYLSRAVTPPKGNNLLSIIGISMIMGAVFFYTKDTPFPSFYALLPTLGTGLIVLFTDKTTWLYKFLSLKFMVGLGLISYSLYLWHQPVFAFAKHSSLNELSQTVVFGLVAVSIFGAFISWQFVEKPFRNKSQTSGKQIFWSSLFGSLFFIIVGIIGISKNGDLGRFDHTIKSIAATPSGRLSKCTHTNTTTGCLIGKETSPPSIAIIGDSHSAALQKALDSELKIRGKSGLSMAGSWCIPFSNVSTKEQYRDKCLPVVSRYLETVISDPKIETVILVAEWANYTQGYRWGVEGVAFYEDKETKKLSLKENTRVFSRGLNRTIKMLNQYGKKVIFIKSVPEYQQDVPNYLAKSMALTGKADMGEYTIDRDAYFSRNSEVEQSLNENEYLLKNQVIDSFEILCPNDICQYITNKHDVLYSDDNHLSEAGAKLLVKEIFIEQ